MFFIGQESKDIIFNDFLNIKKQNIILMIIQKQRKEWIDALRGIAMIIVMVWHFSNGVNGQYLYSVITAPIMIPLFFAITGYVFNNCNGDAKTFYIKLIKYLVFPWIALALLKGACIAITRHSFGYYIEFIKNLFTGENLWYFPCCIIAEIIFFYTLKICKNKIHYIVCLSSLLTAFGFLLSKWPFFDNLNINTAFICQSFLLIGLLIRKYDTPGDLLSIIIGIVYFIIICITPPQDIIGFKSLIDIHLNYYWNIGISFIIILLGNVFLFHTANKYDHSIPSLLKFIGQNTIVFYVFHYDTMMPFNIITNKLGLTDTSNWYFVFIKLIWATACCTIIAILLNKTCPAIVGKRTSNRS